MIAVVGHRPADISLNTCHVTLQSRTRCDAGVCDTVVVTVRPVLDNIDDPDSVNRIEFDVLSDDDHHLSPVIVSVESHPGATCHIHTDPHILTFDGLRYDLYHTGTFVLLRSVDGRHETQVRLWRCGAVSCVCGVTTRDGNDVVSVDMCDGDYGDTLPQLSIYNLNHDKIKTSVLESRGGKILMIQLGSGRSLHVFLEYWGLSISVETTPADHGQTR